MALKSTIYKVELQVVDLDRDHYETYPLTLARHPSETDERMMVRLLAFALNAHPDLQFTRGLSTDDEPDLWRKDLTGAIDCWIDLGMPDEKRLRKACGRARQVMVHAYGGARSEIWWQQIRDRLDRFANLTVINLPKPATQALAGLADRSLDLQCTIQEGTVWMRGQDGAVEIEPQIWLGPGSPGP